MPAGLLAAPAIAMRFTKEVQWTVSGFVIGFVLLFGTAALIELAVRKGGTTAYRLGAGMAVLTALLLLWINGAVGVIGNEENPANLIFLAVIGVSAAGAVFARFEARGMARAMLAAAVLQASIAGMVPIMAWGNEDPPGIIGLMMLIGAFAVLWGLSAALFAKAARDNARPDDAR